MKHVSRFAFALCGLLAAGSTAQAAPIVLTGTVLDFGPGKFFFLDGHGVGGNGVIINSNVAAGQQNAFERWILLSNSTIGGPGRFDVRGGSSQIDLAGFTLTKKGAGQFSLVGSLLTNGNVNVALVPLGTPLLAGPGAIVATIVFVERVDRWQEAAALAAGIVAVHVMLWLSMRYSVAIIRVIRDSGVTLITRIAGLLLSAIAVQLVADAVIAFVQEA